MINPHEQINLRQICLCYLMYSTAIKVLSLPATLASGCGNLAWLAALIGATAEVILVFIATLLLRYLRPKSLIFRILCFTFIPVIIAEVWFTSTEIYHLAYTDLFTDLSLLIFVLTLVLLGSYFLTRQPRSFFRASEILWWLFIFGLVIAIIPPLYNVTSFAWEDLVQGDFTKFTPTAFSNLLFFESATFIFAFGSETEKTPRELRKINLTAILCAIGYVVFVALLVLLFGSLLSEKHTAIIEITTGAQSITADGGWDWLIAVSAMSALILRFGLQVCAITTLVKRGLRKNG